MDTHFLTAALAEWQRKSDDQRTWEELTPKEQSEIMRDAQELKLKANGGRNEHGQRSHHPKI